MSDSTQPRQRRLTYLISQYPAVNHTFILREVLCLRALGWDVQTVSLRDCDRPSEKLTTDEGQEQVRTLYVRSAGLPAFFRAHLATFLKRPVAYVKGFLFALGLGHVTAAQLVRNAAYFAQAIVVGSWMERERMTHVHTHFASTLALIVNRVFGLAFSITVHGPDEFTDPTGFSFAQKCKQAAFVVAISDFARSQIMRFSDYRDWHKYEVCRLGISPEVFKPIAAHPAPQPIRLICVARLSPVKGQHVLISAVDRVVRMGVDVVLHLVGDGVERPNLEAEVKRLGLEAHVRFDGWLNQDGVQAIYRQSDIFVLGSFAEGVPVVLMEAMAMEIPCIATNVNGVPELITDGVSGLLVPASDTDGLAEAILKLAADPSLRRRMGAAGRQRVLERYDLHRNASELAAIFSHRLLDTGDDPAAHRSAVNAVEASAPRNSPVMQSENR